VELEAIAAGVAAIRPGHSGPVFVDDDCRPAEHEPSNRARQAADRGLAIPEQRGLPPDDVTSLRACLSDSSATGHRISRDS
jgi:hypothetical protein